jgi:opacity protein-like surface antigen
MRSFWKTVSIGALAILLATAANAADLPRRQPLPPPSSMPPPPLLQSAPSLVDEFSSGWYLRGDIGYRQNKVNDVRNAIPPQPTDDDLGKSWLAGAGVGYKLSWFRADLTADYGMKAKYSGDTVAATDDFNAKIDSVTGLMNIYGDLGTWYGLTPYIGAGAGFAHLQTSGFSRTFLGGPDADSTGKWNFAWAYMAGLSYKITGNYHVDLGYRHINMGGVTTGLDTFGNQLEFKKLSADELRFGFRYVLD